MKRIILLILIAVTAVGCSKDESNGESRNDETPFTLEGEWYVSGSTCGFLNDDSVNYSYKEKVIGYQEHIFEKVQKKDVNYTMKTKMMHVKRKEDESDNDYVNRLMTGNFTVDDLSWVDINTTFKVNGREMYTYLWGKESGQDVGGLFLVAKIISCTKDQVKIASISPSLIDFSWNEPIEYKYYITLKRIP